MIEDSRGNGILIHAGIDTVSLGGRGFLLHVAAGDTVRRDQLIMEEDLQIIRSAGLSPMVITVMCE